MGVNVVAWLSGSAYMSGEEGAERVRYLVAG